MSSKEVVEYIRKNLRSGYSEEQIKHILLKHGHDSAEVDKAFKKVSSHPETHEKEPEEPEEGGWREDFENIGKATREHKPKKGFTYCNKCGRGFRDKSKAEQHMKKCRDPINTKISGLIYAIGAWLLPLGSFMIALYPETHSSNSVEYIMTIFPYLLAPSMIVGFIFFYAGAKSHQKNIYMKYKKTLSWWLYIAPLFGSVAGFLSMIVWIRSQDKKIAGEFTSLYAFTIGIIIVFTAAFLVAGTFLIDSIYPYIFGMIESLRG